MVQYLSKKTKMAFCICIEFSPIQNHNKPENFRGFFWTKILPITKESVSNLKVLVNKLYNINLFLPHDLVF